MIEARKETKGSKTFVVVTEDGVEIGRAGGNAYTTGDGYWIKRVGSRWHTYHAAQGIMTRLVATHPTLAAAAESLARITRTH